MLLLYHHQQGPGPLHLQHAHTEGVAQRETVKPMMSKLSFQYLFLPLNAERHRINRVY